MHREVAQPVFHSGPIRAYIDYQHVPEVCSNGLNGYPDEGQQARLEKLKGLKRGPRAIHLYF